MVARLERKGRAVARGFVRTPYHLDVGIQKAVRCCSIVHQTVHVPCQDALDCDLQATVKCRSGGMQERFVCLSVK